MSKNAFSLTEISITLIVTSLIIAGAAGMSFIKERSEVIAITDMIRTLNNSYNEFINLYDNKPGDLWNASEVLAIDAENGNGNGIIDIDARSQIDERFLSIKHLSLAGMIKKENYSGRAITTNSATSEHQQMAYSPKIGRFKKTSLYFLSNQQGETMIILARISDANEDGIISASEAMEGAISPNEARAIDEKFDDGKPQSGLIITSLGTNYTREHPCTNGSTNEYARNDKASCVMKFIIDQGKSIF